MSDTFFNAYQEQIENAKKAFSVQGFPAFDMPAGVREAAEKGLASVRENYEKLKTSSDQVNAAIENSCTSAAKGVALYNSKVVEALQSNVTATFDYLSALLQAKTPAEVMEISAIQVRKQFEALTGQAKDLSNLAQQVAADTSAPLKTSVEKTLKSAA